MTQKSAFGATRFDWDTFLGQQMPLPGGQRSGQTWGGFFQDIGDFFTQPITQAGINHANPNMPADPFFTQQLAAGQQQVLPMQSPIAANQSLAPQVIGGTAMQPMNDLNFSVQQPVVQQPSTQPAVVHPAAAAAPLVAPQGTSMLDGYTQYADAMQQAGVNGLNASVGSLGEQGMFQDMANFFGLDNSKDLFAGVGAAAQLGLGAYGMFQGIEQGNRQLDIAQGKLDLAQADFDEKIRHRQAVVSNGLNAAKA